MIYSIAISIQDEFRSAGPSFFRGTLHSLPSTLNTVSPFFHISFSRTLPEAIFVYTVTPLTRSLLTMTRPSFFLALAQAILIQGLPARHGKRVNGGIDERAITLSTGLDITTSYVSTLQSLQTATVTASPTLTGVRIAYHEHGPYASSFDILQTDN
jgi:hypothetical protein